MISLGKGFYNFNFTETLDRDKIWAAGVWTVKPGHLRLQPWTPDFNPNYQRLTNAQIWIKLHDLPWEYWDASILKNIARGVGIPLKIDQNTLEGKFGHYARILVDIDLSKEITDSLMIERQGHKFFISVEFENIPAFCRNCSMVGHSLANCKRNPGTKKIDSKAENKSVKEKNSKILTATLEENIPSKSLSNSDLNVNVAAQDPISDDNSSLNNMEQANSPTQDMSIHDNPIAEFSGAPSEKAPKVTKNALHAESPTVFDPQRVLSSDQHVEINSVSNPEGIMISIDLPSDVIPAVQPISSEAPSDIALRDANIVTSNSWADLADVVDEIPKQTKAPKGGKKQQKNSMAARPRRGHVLNPAL